MGGGGVVQEKGTGKRVPVQSDEGQNRSIGSGNGQEEISHQGF